MSARGWALFARGLGDLGHAVPVHQAGGRRDVAEPRRLVEAGDCRCGPPSDRLEAGRPPRARRPLANPGGLRGGGDGDPVAADRLRRGAHLVFPHGDSDRRGAARGRPARPALRSFGATHSHPPGGDADRFRGRGVARGHRHRRTRRRARGCRGDPPCGCLLRDRPDDRQATALRRRPARARSPARSASRPCWSRLSPPPTCRTRRRRRRRSPRSRSSASSARRSRSSSSSG